MKKSLAEIFGSFFLLLIPFFLIGIITLGSGCAGSPPPTPTDESEGDAKLFYARPNQSVEDETPAATPVGTPSHGAVAGSSKYSPPEEPDISPTPPDETSDYLISSYDVISISVLGEEDLSVTARVSERGSISFPLLGEVRVAGYTTIQFERRLEELLEKDYLVSPSVNISILEYSTISILGQVNKPGAYEIKGKITVSQSIALAGGLTKIASPNGTKVIRKVAGEEKVITIPLNDILKDGDLSGDISLKPGDLIVVPESFF
jgi:polysaccharide export outer membrane protein